MNYNINFTSNLYYGDIAGNKKRWANIAQTFQENTKHNRYEQKLGSSYDVHIYHDENNRLTIQASNEADSFEPRECVLSKEGEKNLLALSDNKISEKLEKLLDIVIDRDKTIKERDAILDYYPDRFDVIIEESVINKMKAEVKDKIDTEIIAQTYTDKVFKDAEFKM